MADGSPLPPVVTVLSKPGIKRDGTRLEGDQYVDGRWVRFDRGLPRKIAGYRAVNKYLQGLVRTLSAYTQNNLTYVHGGSAERIERLFIDNDFNTSVIADRTPASGLTADPRNLWCFTVDTKVETGVPTNLIIGQVAPNLNDITNADGGELFSGLLTGTDPLTPISLPTGGNATGGVVALHPYTFFYGSNGYIGWSVANNPTDLSGAGSGAVNATSQKVVSGLPLRGGPGNSPSGLFWSADALVRASFVGGAPVFQFDTLSTQSSIMSSRCVIEYDGVFYWLGIDRFLMFNGVVREVPNLINKNYFFDNLNFSQRQKVFATKVPRWGEIWWCYPSGGSEECDQALIYNVREQTWYDTALPDGGRASGLFPTVFPRPLMTGATPTVNPTIYRVTETGQSRITEDNSLRVTEESLADRYKLWVHEQGTDEVDGQTVSPIRSYFETSDISLPAQYGVDRASQALMLEPDFVQSGDMTVQVVGNVNARSPVVTGEALTFPEVPDNGSSDPQDWTVHMKTQRRHLRFIFESNTVGGHYEMGTSLLHLRPGDGRST